MAPEPIQFSTIQLRTVTDNDGNFSIPHGLEVEEREGVYHIEGIVVAVEHQNGDWHTVERSDEVDNNVWWNTTVVAGRIASPDFHNKDVKTIIFYSFEQIPPHGL